MPRTGPIDAVTNACESQRTAVSPHTYNGQCDVILWGQCQDPNDHTLLLGIKVTETSLQCISIVSKRLLISSWWTSETTMKVRSEGPIEQKLSNVTHYCVKFKFLSTRINEI